MRQSAGLSDGEWKLMNLLWDHPPCTISQMVSALKEDTGWSKGTIFMMLSRMEEKGAVRHEDGGRSKLFFPVWERQEAAAQETKSFLSKVFGGSVGMLVSSIAGQKALSKEDIQELYGILRKAEEEAE